MLLAFTIVMAPWWIRNYAEYGIFAPLAESSGNLVTRYLYRYNQTPDKTVLYRLGKMP